MAKRFKDDCEAAIKLLTSKGNKWIKGEENDGEGGFCMIGALDHVGADTSEMDNLHQEAFYCTIEEYNDAKKRTKAQVIKRLRQLADFEVMTPMEVLKYKKIYVQD